MAESLATVGIDIHVPHKDFDREDRDQTYVTNRRHIARSHLVVFYYDLPSTGVGQEIELAAMFARPVVLLINERRETVSTMIDTSFLDAEKLVFDDLDDIRRELPDIALRHARPPLQVEGEPGQAVHSARRRLGISRFELARRSYCPVALIDHLEDDPADVVQLGPAQLAEIGRSLGIELRSAADPRRPTFERRVISRAAQLGQPAASAQAVLDMAARELGPPEALSDAELDALFAVVEDARRPPA